MATSIEPTLTPRQGTTLRVLAVCRISTEHQDPRSLDDQEALLRRVVADSFTGTVDWTSVKSRGSGELLDREELARIEALLETQHLDLLLVEDLARICRRTRAYDFCELAEDCGTRLIAVNDHVDTRRDGWRMHAFFSVMHHELSNRDTSERIRRSHRNRFIQGGVIQYVIYGYIKPEGATHDGQLSKHPDAGPIYDEWFRRLEEGASYAEISDWLNARGIQPGRYVRRRQWTPRLVADVTHNPILKGLRVRNRMVTVRINRTGRRRKVRGEPGDLLRRVVPHLAFIEPDRYDRVIALLKARNAKYRTGGGTGNPRLNVPRKRTRWPGQHLRCGLCGSLLYYGAHGGKDRLACSDNRDYACWNSTTTLGTKAAEKLLTAALAEIGALAGFEPTFRGLVAEELARLQAGQGDRIAELDRERQRVERQLANVVASLSDIGPTAELKQAYARLQEHRDRLAAEQAQLAGGPRQALAVPPLADLVEPARASLRALAGDSPEFARRMHELLPRLDAYPYRAVDGGNVVLRAHATLDLVALIPGARGLQGSPELLRRELVVDLFDPPRRIAMREAIVTLGTDGHGRTQRQIAAELGIAQRTVYEALALTGRMAELGLTDPYVPLTEPPADCNRFRKHRHPRFHAQHAQLDRHPDAAPSNEHT
jgi:DNA invertase Pin-like site-specific DNA recombinase